MGVTTTRSRRGVFANCQPNLQMLLVKRDEMIQCDPDRLGFVVEVVVRPALGDDEFLLLGGGALDDLTAVAVGAKSSWFVTNDNAHRLSKQNFGEVESVP